LNYVDTLSKGSSNGAGGGDRTQFLVSLRNVSAFGLIDSVTGRLVRVFRGSFVQQHGVRFIDAHTVVMMDNCGGDYAGGPSRVLLFDLADGKERTLFPNALSKWPGTFTKEAGNIDISADHKRVIATFTHSGRAYEISLSDGQVLGAFDNLQDVSSLKRFGTERNVRAARFAQYGVYYAKD
jgi:hypothetical protein